MFGVMLVQITIRHLQRRRPLIVVLVDDAKEFPLVECAVPEVLPPGRPQIVPRPRQHGLQRYRYWRRPVAVIVPILLCTKSEEFIVKLPIEAIGRDPTVGPELKDATLGNSFRTARAAAGRCRRRGRRGRQIGLELEVEQADQDN